MKRMIHAGLSRYLRQNAHRSALSVAIPVLGLSGRLSPLLAHFLLATLFFAAGAVFGYLVSWCDRDAARAYPLPPHTIRPVEEGEEATAPYNTDQLTEFSGFLFTHNLSVTLFAFALGITFGLGTAWMMFYNGVITGVLAAVFVESQQFWRSPQASCRTAYWRSRLASLEERRVSYWRRVFCKLGLGRGAKNWLAKGSKRCCCFSTVCRSWLRPLVWRPA
jgi:hypothetical protein